MYLLFELGVGREDLGRKGQGDDGSERRGALVMHSGVALRCVQGPHHCDLAPLGD